MNMQMLSSALDDIIVSLLKQNEAPLASESHLHSAIIKILSVLPRYDIDNEEEVDVVLTAIGQQISYLNCVKEVN